MIVILCIIHRLGGMTGWMAFSLFFIMTVVLIPTCLGEELTQKNGTEDGASAARQRHGSGVSVSNKNLRVVNTRMEPLIRNLQASYLSTEVNGSYDTQSVRDMCSRVKLPAESSFNLFMFKQRLCTDPTLYASFRIPRAMPLCFKRYREVYDEIATPTPILFRASETILLKIFYQKRLVDVCLPLFRQSTFCTDMLHGTLCLPDQVLFLNHQDCERPSDWDKFFEIFQVKAILRNDHYCLNLVCKGLFRVIVQNVNGMEVQILKVNWDFVSKNCSYLYKHHEFSTSFPSDDKVLIAMINLFFPCCYPLHTVVWNGIPEERGVNRYWDYLPFWCRVSEVSLAAVVVCTGVTGTLGNLLVIIVLLRSNHRGEESSILRTSLAFADLSTSIFVVIPSFYYHVMPIRGYIDIGEKYVTFQLGIHNASGTDRYNTNIRVIQGYRLFQGLTFGVCSIVSLLTLFLLSVERFIATGRALRYQHYFTIPRVKFSVVLTWSIAILDTLFFVFDGNGGFELTWSTMAKIPISVSNRKVGAVMRWAHSVHVLMLVFLCLSTVTLSLLSIRNFVREQTRVVSEWRALGMRVSGPFASENRHILTTMCIMTLLFATSTGPRGLRLAFYHTGYLFLKDDLFEYLSWWFFLASCSWNPWIYNMRSRQFRKDVEDFFLAVLPSCLKEKLQRADAAAQARERRMLRRLNLIDESSL